MFRDFNILNINKVRDYKFFCEYVILQDWMFLGFWIKEV